ncbi:MAG TPA: hypothetical protein VN328_13135, partial [Thermodesulfovibrionales bacterium]|nr:hypothetical protein [Thermodesulfovibrionales bacterium]
MPTSLRIVAAAIISAVFFIPVYGKVVSQIGAKTMEEKLGYLPQKETMKIFALDHKALLSEWIFFKAIVYYGGRVDTENPAVQRNIEYANIYRFLDSATYLDPYNIDAYYFAQAVFAWQLGKVREVNRLLQRGVEYRTWDFHLPFFLGFNNFYFLKDYKAASQYMKQVALLTDNNLATTLAARFFYESGETEAAITFLKFMIEKTWKENLRKLLETRLRALESIDVLEKGVKRFEGIYNRKPASIDELVRRGIIDKLPEDPYGGNLYIDKSGKIRTTSEFVLRGAGGD